MSPRVSCEFLGVLAMGFPVTSATDRIGRKLPAAAHPAAVGEMPAEKE